MNNKAVIPSSIRQINSLNWCLWLFLDWSVIVIAIFIGVSSNYLFVKIIAVLIIGRQQHSLGILGHDGTHFLAFKNRFVNDLISNLFIFWPIFWTVEGYRKFHFNHHRYTGKIEDPEFVFKKAVGGSWIQPFKIHKLVIDVLLDLMGRGIFGLAGGFTELLRPPKWFHQIGPVIWPVFSSSCLIYFGLWEVVALWYISFGTSFTVFMRLRMWIEHAGTLKTHRIYLNWLEAYFLAPHNTWYHWEHHKYQQIPCFNLPKIRKIDDSEPCISLKDFIYTIFKNDF